ncbi:hypothetical protein [Dokdonella soli]|uniref:Thymidylate kinase n=1 Tax=Dokdonella soli TaxID=529810 RepID=A0ABN1IHV3_9GAMM
MKTETIPGLLIEGVDYSGKTAVSTELERIMRERGYEPYRRACFMHEHPIIDGLLALAKASQRMDERDICYTASILLDLTLPALPSPPGYLLQERHVQTQIGRNTFFYEDDERWQVTTLRRLRRCFSTQVYLTSNLAAKRERTRTRTPKSPRDALLAEDVLLHQRYDDYMRDTLPGGEAWLVIDTSVLSIADVAGLILDQIETFDECAAFARV